MNYEVQSVFEAYEYFKDISQQENDIIDDDDKRNNLMEQRIEAEGRLNRLFKKAVKTALLE